MIEIGINSAILSTIRDGRKVVEGRLCRGKFLDVAVGDVISIREDFYENGSIARSVADSLRVVIDDVQEFDSFKSMLEATGYTNAISDAQSLPEAINAYHSFYSENDEREFGVLAMHFHVSDSQQVGA